MTPRVGRYWDGHGGIYAGITPGKDCDYHLILSLEDMKRDVIWENALVWARAARADGHSDFDLPDLKQAALLYANLKECFDPVWYWSRDPYPPDLKACAWVQTFGYGRQADARITDACRARAVRVEPCV